MPPPGRGQLRVLYVLDIVFAARFGKYRIGTRELQLDRSRLAESRTRMVSSRQDLAADGAVRVGEDLRAARERIGWALEECASGLRIRLPYLQALEDGRVGDLPGRAYAMGFLRTYGTALGLDADLLCRRFKADVAAITAKTRLAFPVPAPERGIPGGAVLLLAFVMVVGAYIGWYRLSGEGRLPAEVVPAVPARLAPLADQAVPLPTPVPVPPMVAVVVPEDDGLQMPAFSPSSAAAAMPLPPLPVMAPPAVGVALTPANPDDPRIVLRARADAWIQVRDKSGQILVNRVLHPGESWAVPPRPGLLLTTGNAGGTDVVLDGTLVVSLAGAGAVRRDLPLDPDAIRDGRLAATAATAPPVPAPRAVTN
jgi:cytoskeleton protein RodZ